MCGHQQVAAVEFTDLLKQRKEVVLPGWIQQELRLVQQHKLFWLGIKDQQAQQVDQLLFSGREFVQLERLPQLTAAIHNKQFELARRNLSGNTCDVARD